MVDTGSRSTGDASFFVSAAHLDFLALLLFLLSRYQEGGVLNTCDGAGKTEVAELDSAVLVNKNVGRLEVSMNDVALMEVLDSTKQVVNYRGDMQKLQVDTAFNYFLEIALGELHDHVEGFETVGFFWGQQLDEFDDHGVAQLAEEGDLTENALAVDLVLEDVLHALDGDLFARRLLSSLADLAVAASAQNLGALVVVAHFPVSELVQVEGSTFAHAGVRSDIGLDIIIY